MFGDWGSFREQEVEARWLGQDGSAALAMAECRLLWVALLIIERSALVFSAMDARAEASEEETGREKLEEEDEGGKVEKWGSQSACGSCTLVVERIE